MNNNNNNKYGALESYFLLPIVFVTTEIYILD